MDLSRYDASGFDRGAAWWKEALWRLCQGLFFQPLWHVPSPVRVFWLRLFGAKIGRAVVIRAGVNIHFPWRLELGDHVWLGEEVMINSLAPVRIGSQVCISQRAFLCTGSHAYERETFDLVTQPITVEDGCWVAAMAFVGPGVTLGKGSVVGAGAVVMKSIPAGSQVRSAAAVVVKQDAGE
ncbi:MAG: colanic acid biosynthesis acetyltransferase WcaF [Blastochloris sp.]|nr:colanic acid biosynthesis acetyltransferase WcaF [Blastochloris sp.]